MGSGFDRFIGVVLHENERVMNSVKQTCFVPPRVRKTRQMRISSFGKLVPFLVFPSITFHQVQEGGELVQ